MKPKRIYFCETAWDHEIGETSVEAFSHPSQCKHTYCGIIEAKVTFVRRVRKEKDGPGRYIPVRQMKHEQLKSIRKEIENLKKLYEVVKKQK